MSEDNIYDFGSYKSLMAISNSLKYNKQNSTDTCQKGEIIELDEHRLSDERKRIEDLFNLKSCKVCGKQSKKTYTNFDEPGKPKQNGPYCSRECFDNDKFD